MKLSELLNYLKEWEMDGETKDWDREISMLSIDTRKLQAGALFICMQGENMDSHAFVSKAEKLGAVAIVAEKKLSTQLPVVYVKDTRKAVALLASAFYGEPSKYLKLIGITGTNGKTTTSYMLASILRATGKKVGIIGTLGVVYGDCSTSSALTTPDAIELHAYFADMVKAGVEYVVMEVSAHALYYKKIEGIHFDICVFTNFTQDHLDFFKNMEAYKKAKLALFSFEKCRIAVVNGDDEVGREVGDLRGHKEVVYYGLTTPTDCFAVVMEETIKQTECIFNFNDKLYRTRLNMLGEYNIYNALAAATCGELLGAGKGISPGLYQLKNVCGRLQRVQHSSGLHIYVDFAHTPDGLEKSLKTLKPYCEGRLICLFGCGGNRDKSKRAPMGEIAAKVCDFAVLTSDNPRYEDPLDIIGEIEQGYRRFSNRYVIIPDRWAAIDYALDCLQKEDILLIAGKGGEEYQEIMGIKYPFNDQDIVIRLLEQKGKK